MSNKDKYLQSAPAVYPEVKLPDGQTIHVRKIPLSRVIELEGFAKDTTVMLAKWIVATACDENGTPIFDDTDIPALNAKDAEWGLPIFYAAKEINNISAKAVEEKKSQS